MAGTGNRPARERFDFSLDARQVAGVILGSLGALGMAFFLGHALGQRVAERPAPAPHAPAPAAPPADALAALDKGPPPDGGEPKTPISFYETLTAARPPPDRLPATPKAAAPPAAQQQPPVAKAAPVAAPGPLAAAPAPAPSPTVPSGTTGTVGTTGPPAPTGPAAGGPAKGAAPAPTSAAPQAAPTAPPLRKGASEKGGWVVQVGSTQERFEADRIAARFAGRGARVSVADVPGKGRWYRVRLGSFDTREAADRYLKDLERSTGARGFVASAN